MYPPVFITHAQNGEDVLLWRALKDVKKGYYIDVGAQDPLVDSVTKAFYERGWCGINIEPMPHWYERLAADRPHDINLPVAVADKPGKLKLFEVIGTGLSTSDPEFAHRHEAGGYTLKERAVECTTLDRICSDNNVSVVHFLKIDCEGAERSVLQGMSFRAVRPWIVLVEATEPNSTAPTWDQWEDLLTGRGYEYVFFDGLNRYYVAEEHADLGAAFNAPVNVFDNAHRASEVAAQSEIDRLQNKVQSLEGAAGAATLKEQLAAQKRECGVLHQRVVALTAERDAAAAQVRSSAEALQIVVPALQTERAEGDARAETDRRDLAAQIEALSTELDAAVTRARADYEALQSQIDIASIERDAAVDNESELQRELSVDREQLRRSELLNAALLSSRSWRVTAPLRIASLASRRAVYVALRPLAHALRPVMRWSARNAAARRATTLLLGRRSGVTTHLRLFLFGAPATDPSTGGAQLTAPKPPFQVPVSGDALTQPRASNTLLPEPDRPAPQIDGEFDVDLEMERIRAELKPLQASGGGTSTDRTVAAPGQARALTADELMVRVRAEIARRRPDARNT